MMDLSNDLCLKITNLSEIGDQLFEQNKLDESLAKYNEALDLIPEPKSNWEASSWLFVAIGDVLFCMEYYKKAVSYFHDAWNLFQNQNNPLYFSD